jgi:hypothetical protein
VGNRDTGRCETPDDRTLAVDSWFFGAKTDEPRRGLAKAFRTGVLIHSCDYGSVYQACGLLPTYDQWTNSAIV